MDSRVNASIRSLEKAMTADQAEQRIACSLEPAELSDRRSAWERLAEHALRERRSIPSGMQLVFIADEGVEDQLRELARLEGQCCSFADWTVESRNDELVLDVTAPTEAVPAVRALFDGALRVE